MKALHTEHTTIRWLAALAAVVWITGCGGTNWFSYTGWQVKPGNREALEEGGPHAAVWTTNDLILHYRYQLQGGRLDIEGSVERQDRIKNFPNLTAWVSIHFLDPNGIIVETHRLWSQSGSDVFGGLNWEFHHTWQLPPDNRAVAFSFSGSAGEGGTRWEFWRTP